MLEKQSSKIKNINTMHRATLIIVSAVVVLLVNLNRYMIRVQVQKKTKMNQQYAWHHYLVIVGLLITAGNGGYIMMANGAAFCVEISTIFSNLICLMEQLKWDQSKAYLSFGIFMAITFFIFRIIFPAFLNYIIWQ